MTEDTEIQKAARNLDEQIESAMSILKIDRPAATKFVLERPEGRAAYVAFELAKKSAFTAIPISKSAADRVTKAGDAMAALKSEVLAFGKAHNLAPAEADARYKAVDPTFDGRFRKAYAEQRDAEHAGFAEREDARRVEVGKRMSAERDVELKKQAIEREAAEASLVPADREFSQLVTKFMAEHKCAASTARVALMKTAKGRELYNDAAVQKSQRLAGRSV